MLRECGWNMLTPLPAAEIAGRIGQLLDRRTDFTRNLHVPPEYAKHADESGFQFAVTPAWGGNATLFHCSGTLRNAGSQTAVDVRLRLAPSAWWVPIGVGIFFWAVLIVTLYPVSMLILFGSFAGLACVVTALISLMAWYGFRACRRGINDLLSSEPVLEIPEATGPKYPWWELLGAGLFSYFAAGFTWWYLARLEQAPGPRELRLPA